MGIYKMLTTLIKETRELAITNAKLRPVEKDIFSEIKTKQWKASDTGKKVVIAFQKDGTINNRTTGFVDSIGSGHSSTGGCHISLGSEFIRIGVVWDYFYNTENREWVGVKIISSRGGITSLSIDPTFKKVLEFYIWEDNFN